MRTLICGDREWTNIDRIRSIMEFSDITLLIEGEARGADKMSRLIAEEMGIPFKPFPANWARFSLGAGPIRNLEMIVEGNPDIVFAFHNDITHSKGTGNMIYQAKIHSIPVIVYTDTDWMVWSK